MPKYKYTYFDGRGRGEPARMLFAVAGVEFEDVRIQFQDWPKLKPETPGGSLPYLEVQDGKEPYVITQSLVIFRHLARTFGLDGHTLLQKVKVEEIVEYLTEIKLAMFGHMFAAESDKKEKWDKFIEQIKKSCKRVEEILKEVASKGKTKSSNAWAVGDKMTFADIMMYETFEQVEPMLQKENCSEVLGEFVHVKKCCDQMKENKNLQKYIEKRDREST